MKLSTELEILIESIKVVLLKKSNERLIFLLENQKINWGRLEKMAKFHAIRPIVYEAFREVGFENDFAISLKKYCIQQVAKNLMVTNELKHLLSILEKEGIKVLPYKGLAFIEKLYVNRQLREVGDLDLIVHDEDKVRAIEILLKDGYSFEEKVELFIKKNSINEIFEYWAKEVGLDKGQVHIDFHWHLYEEHRNIKIDMDRLFQDGIDSNNTFFLMLVNHHGGRDCWLKLKYLSDLIMFDKLGQNWSELQELSKKTNLYNTTNVGIQLLNKMFDYQIHQADFTTKHNEKSIQLITKYWEFSEPWIKVLNRLKYERVFISLQDKSFSSKKYILSYFRNFSKPNPIEQSRFITFPKNYPILNFISKFISFLIKKAF